MGDATVTKVEAIGTRKICIRLICEVQSHSENSQKELVWPGKIFGGDHWDLAAGHNPKDTSEIAVGGSMSFKVNARCVPRCFFEVSCGISEF